MLLSKPKTYFSLFVLILIAISVWSAVFSKLPEDVLKVIFFDVGQGDSIFIEFNNKQILIDGGPDKSILEKLNQEMPFFDRDIDILVLTHPDADHLTGLVSVLKFFEIGHIITSGFQKDTRTYKKWRQLIKEKNIDLTLAKHGQRIILDDKIKINTLWPPFSIKQDKANNASVVMRVDYKDVEFLLTGDIEKDIEKQIIAQTDTDKIKSDILKIAHHGSKSSTGKNFLDIVNPEVSIISVGEDNWYGHPHKLVLEKLKNTSVFRTDKDGNIEIFTDGQVFQICSEKKTDCLIYAK